MLSRDIFKRFLVYWLSVILGVATIVGALAGLAALENPKGLLSTIATAIPICSGAIAILSAAAILYVLIWSPGQHYAGQVAKGLAIGVSSVLIIAAIVVGVDYFTDWSPALNSNGQIRESFLLAASACAELVAIVCLAAVLRKATKDNAELARQRDADEKLMVKALEDNGI